MTQAWYQVLSMCFGYAGAVIIALVVLLAARKLSRDRGVWRRVRRSLPQAGAAGTLQVLSSGRRLPAGELLRVPYEGTMGASHSCDVCIPVRGVHMRSAFFWMEEDGLHMVALHRDGFLADGVPVEPGDEAVLRDGAVLCVGEAKLALRLSGTDAGLGDGPYVTRARRSRAQQGHGEGIGAPGKGEARRERKRLARETKARGR